MKENKDEGDGKSFKLRINEKIYMGSCGMFISLCGVDIYNKKGTLDVRLVSNIRSIYM